MWLRAGLLVTMFLPATVRADDLTLQGTAPLRMPENVVEEQLAQVDGYFRQRIASAEITREQRWPPAAASDDEILAHVQAQREALRRMLGLGSFSAPLLVVQAEVMAAHPEVRVERITIPIADALAARGLLFVPPTAGRHPVALVCSDADTWPERFTGVQDAGQFAAWLQQLLAGGVAVYVPQSIERMNDHPYCQRLKVAVGQSDSPGKDRRWILYRLGYVVGHTMPGLDVQDVLAAIDYLTGRSDVDARRVGIAGIGQGGMTALYAAAVDTRVAAAVVTDYFCNRSECWLEPIDRRLPGQLVSWGDAEVAALSAPRTLTVVRSPQSSTAADSVATEFSRARRLSQRCRAGESLALVDVPVEQDAVEFTMTVLARALQASGPGSGAAWPRCAVSADDAASARNRHFEERLQWLRRLVDRSEADRYRRWGLLTSPAARLDKVREGMLSDYRQLVGEVPRDGRPLRPRTELALVTDKYRAYRVMLDVTDGIEVYGNLLIPRDIAGPAAAVICQHGLSGRPEMITGLGMTEDTVYHEFGRQLAEQGYVVFAPLILHYHPVELTNRQARQADAIGLMRVALVRAQTECVIDFLQSLPSVDRQRIGYYGLSYGGYSAIWLAPLVPRLQAVVISGHFNDWRSKITADDVATSYLQHPDEDFYSWDILHRFTHVELIAMTAPRPVCIEFGERDGITSPAWTAYAWQQVRDIEAHAGRLGRVALARFDGVHEIHGVESFAFLDRHLRFTRGAERD